MRETSEPVVCRWLAAGDAGDVDAFDELLHVDAVIHAPAGLSTTGLAAEKAVWQDALAAMPDLCHLVQEVLVDGDVEMARVVVTGTMSARFGDVEGTGRSFRMDQAVITHLRDGKVTEAWEIADVALLRAQVSVQSPQGRRRRWHAMALGAAVGRAPERRRPRVGYAMPGPVGRHGVVGEQVRANPGQA